MVAMSPIRRVTAGQCRQHRQAVGPTGDIEIEETAGVLAHPQTLGEEEEVEFRALRRPRERDE
jgi:hypothetical protein